MEQLNKFKIIETASEKKYFVEDKSKIDERINDFIKHNAKEIETYIADIISLKKTVFDNKILLNYFMKSSDGVEIIKYLIAFRTNKLLNNNYEILNYPKNYKIRLAKLGIFYMDDRDDFLNITIFEQRDADKIIANIKRQISILENSNLTDDEIDPTALYGEHAKLMENIYPEIVNAKIFTAGNPNSFRDYQKQIEIEHKLQYLKELEQKREQINALKKAYYLLYHDFALDQNNHTDEMEYSCLLDYSQTLIKSYAKVRIFKGQNNI
jgi:hypothetical protein